MSAADEDNPFLEAGTADPNEPNEPNAGADTGTNIGATTTETDDNNNVVNASDADFDIPLKNVLNLIGYILSDGSVFGFDMTNFRAFKSSSYVLRTYPTLMTPDAYAIIIWSVISIFLLVWVILQLVRGKYRNHELVQQGVGYYYFAFCLAQVVSTLTFQLQWIIPALLAMFAMLTFLLLILRSQGALIEAENENYMTWKYWWLRFPFVGATAWILSETLTMINVFFVWAAVSSVAQLIIAILTLMAYLVVAMSAFFYGTSGPYRSESLIIPFVFAWVLVAVFVELGKPDKLIDQRFTTSNIEGIRFTSIALAGFLFMVTVVNGYKNCRRGYQPVQSEDAPYIRVDITD